MIKIRLDVDYAYPSRPKSFFLTFLNVKVKRNYLKNAKIIARMVNESPKEVKAYWFFTPQTIPDKEMLELMRPERHEVALHIVNKPEKELKNLEKATGRKANYYTIHGTERLLGQIVWKRKMGTQKINAPEGFLLKDFWDMPTMILDRVCHVTPTLEATSMAEESIQKGKVLHIHPDWIFNRGKYNHRGPYYNVLRAVLEVDQEFDGLVTQKKGVFKVASYEGTKEYERDFVPTKEFLGKLAYRGTDIFSFIERTCYSGSSNLPKNWAKANDDVALYNVTTYEAWWEGIGKKTRNMIRKAQKSGVTAIVVEPNEKFAEGVWKVYNETPIRQGRAFPYYGIPQKAVTEGVLNAKNCTFIGAYLQNELVGFIQLVHGEGIAIISQILSLQKNWDKAINNAMLAKTIETCTDKQVQMVMYGRMGNHPSLDTFKQNHSFTKFTFKRYYVPLTRKGHIVIKLGLHKPLKNALPQWLKEPLFPVFSWVSRTKLKIRQKLH